MEQNYSRPRALALDVLNLIALDSFDQRIRSIVAGIVPYFE